MATIQDLNDFLRLTQPKEYMPGYTEKRKMAKLASGVTLSIQASHSHYCTPRTNDAPAYSSVEIGYPSAEIPELLEYAEQPEKPTDTVYGYVPVEVLNTVIQKHGGLIL